MLPAIAASLRAIGTVDALVATSVGAFFTTLWNHNLKKDGSYDYTFDTELKKIEPAYTAFDNSIITQTNAALDDFNLALTTYANGLPAKQAIVESNTAQQISAKTNLLAISKSSSIESIEQQKIQNNHLAVKNDIALKMYEAKVLEVSNQNKSYAMLSENLKALNISVATLSTLPKIVAETQDYNLIMSTQIYAELLEIKEAFKAHTTVLKAKEFSADVGSMTQAVSVDVAPLAVANQTIASGVENQILTNAKIVENLHKLNTYYDFMNNGKADFKDSEGNAIKPSEVHARRNAEQLIEQEDTNKTTFDEISDFVSDALGIVEDGVEQVVGSTDGFDLNFNPFAFLDKILVHDYQNHKDNYPANPNSTPPPTS